VTKEIVGHYFVGPDGKLAEDEGYREIYRRLRGMLLLAASGQVPGFYYEPSSKTYWEHIEYEDGQVTLRTVTRDWIERNWPSVRFDKLLEVNWPEK
jgi:hypothetical protein